MKPLLEQLGSMATPRSPISAAVQTEIAISVVVALPSKSLRLPPFSVISSVPLGRKAMAVGAVRLPTTSESVKPAAGVPARAGAASATSAASARALTCWRKDSSCVRSRIGRLLYPVLQPETTSRHRAPLGYHPIKDTADFGAVWDLSL